MKLDGRRESTNVEDRRGMSGGKAAGVGLGGIAIVAIITLLMGGDLGDVLQTVQNAGGLGGAVTDANYVPSEQDEELYLFSSRVLGSTEDVWSKYFQKAGRSYPTPTMVIYTGQTQTACGTGQAAMGPFYCSGDEKLYIDLSFFANMKRDLGADGDFAYAYVIAHEVGHHVQHVLGTLDQAHSQMARMSTTEANKMSVRIELQADFYAGVWARRENDLFSSMEKGDLEEALNTAVVIGDDYLQKKATGRTDERAYTHGTSAQRQRWFQKGFQTGDINQGDTFSIPYNQL